MTKQDIERMNGNGKVNGSRDGSAAYAQQLAFDVAMMKDDGTKATYQAEADLMADIVEYKRLIENLRGGSY